MDYSILVGGAAGQGMDTFSKILDKTLKRCGFYVFTNNDFMSRVRGGHNFTQIRFSDKPIYTHGSEVDLIFALNEEAIKIHKDKLRSGGAIIADKSTASEEEIIHLPIIDKSKELKNTKVYPTVGLGGILKYFGLPLDVCKEVIKDRLEEKVAEINIKALEAGYHMLDKKYSTSTLKDENILISGNEAVGLGAIAAGCKFYCGYPMTPSTGVLSYIASKVEEMGIAIDQVEDEVAALNMALGASYAGVRSMTGSSGGGFSLMVEALSLAGMIETPVVVVNVQRPGPATGLPTRTEQSDLRFLIHAGHGEFPRMIIALRNGEDAFYQTARAFNLAEKYQIPVLLMSDQYLADSMSTFKPFDFSKIDIERYLASGEDIGEDEYKRYKLTQNGVSPRLIPGQIKGKVVLADSDEHDEYGNITEDAEVRKDMVDKRMKKIEGLKNEIYEPWILGDEKAENLIVCWGSTYGAVKEAVERLEAEGVSIGALVYGDIWPFPIKRLMEMSRFAKKIIDIEQNATAQLDSLIREEVLFKCTHKILKYDGRAFSGDEVYDRLKREVL